MMKWISEKQLKDYTDPVDRTWTSDSPAGIIYNNIIMINIIPYNIYKVRFQMLDSVLSFSLINQISDLQF